MTSPERSSFKRWPRRLGIVFAALLVLGAAGEVALRLAPGFGGSQTAIKIQEGLVKPDYALDPELGALLAPSRHYTFETLDYRFNLDLDHAGFPNPEPWPGGVDVAVLGNSLLGGAGVGLEGQFTTLLEHRLGGREVLNLALPGGGTEHEHLTYRRYALPLHPKLVIAVLWVTWDIENALHFERWRLEKSDPDYTHYRKTYGVTHPGGAPVALSTLERAWHFMLRKLGTSYVLKAGYHGISSLLGRQLIRERVTFPTGEMIFLSVRDQKRLAQGIDRPGTPDIREIFFNPLEQLRTEVEAQGGRFVVVLVPSKEELYGAEAFPAILKPVREVKAELEARGLPTLDLYPVFRELAQERPAFYRADMHPNPFGHQIVADAITKWIADQGVFTASSPAPTVAGRG